MYTDPFGEGAVSGTVCQGVLFGALFLVDKDIETTKQEIDDVTNTAIMKHLDEISKYRNFATASDKYQCSSEERRSKVQELQSRISQLKINKEKAFRSIAKTRSDMVRRASSLTASCFILGIF